LPGFGPEFQVTCENHGGPGNVAVAQWDAGAAAWSLISDFAPADASVLDPLIIADSEAYAAEAGVEMSCQ
jgi:branched-chain amino acid transport system substrate-binding protein